MIKKKGRSATGIEQDSVLGSVPSRTEAENAIFELQRFLDGNTGTSPQSSELNKLKQMINDDSRITQSSGYRAVQKAYHLLKTDSSVRRMVVSISSDKAVWDAVLSNKAVQDLRGSLQKAKQRKSRAPQISNEELDLAALILNWILKNTMPRFGELVAKFGLLISEIFQTAKKENPCSEVNEVIAETVKSSMLLSVVILVIVVVSRGHGA